ncbi:uncharacterized protein [Gossypium hirsutum]|uniref:Uncharacterized protein n=1 Tax=Gossypium hirsutum TaxID=3635 RepID=A0ABM3B110_GOSHI|nr:uncharacterized protein LOC121223398 [Gossypium hirsutum]
MLAALLSEFEGVVSSASLSTTPLPFQRLMDVLIEYENRHVPSDQEAVYSANLVEDSSVSVTDGATRGGRSAVYGRGKNFRPRLQCQICSRFGHVAQRCYYRYHRDEVTPMQFLVPLSRESGDRGWSSTSNTRPRFSNLGQGLSQYNAESGQNHYGYGQNSFSLGQNYCADGFNNICGQYAGPIGGGPRLGVENHASRPHTFGPNGGGVRPNFENHGYRPQTSGPNGGGPNGGFNSNFGQLMALGRMMVLGCLLLTLFRIMYSLIRLHHMFRGGLSRELVFSLLQIRALDFLG